MRHNKVKPEHFLTCLGFKKKKFKLIYIYPNLIPLET